VTYSREFAAYEALFQTDRISPQEIFHRYVAYLARKPALFDHLAQTRDRFALNSCCMARSQDLSHFCIRSGRNRDQDDSDGVLRNTAQQSCLHLRAPVRRSALPLFLMSDRPTTRKRDALVWGRSEFPSAEECPRFRHYK
jgi:hypothetical protein